MKEDSEEQTQKRYKEGLAVRRQNLESKMDWHLTNHKPTDDGIKKMETLRELAKDFAEGIIKLCPLGTDMYKSLDSLEITVFHAMASIARNETDDGKAPES